MNAYAIHSDSNTAVPITAMAVRGLGAGIFDASENLTDPVDANPAQSAGVGNSPAGVAPLYPYILFNKSPLQLRRIGARGGKAYGRNQRARRALMPASPKVEQQRLALGQTTAEAVIALDARFPWLRGAERRRRSTLQTGGRTHGMA